MPTDLHCICRTGEALLGGRIYLHERQSDVAWHGATIKFWHYADGSNRKVFNYVEDGDYRVMCTGTWARETATVRR
jgi:hypothetical protein